MTWSFETMKTTMANMMEVNHAAFVKALLAVELSLNHRSLLDQVYQDYKANDGWSLVGEDIKDQAYAYQDQLVDDMTDLFDKLYRTGEGSSFIMDVLSSGHLEETMTHYDVLDPEDYATSSLEELERLIQEELSVSSSDYFGDLTYLAVTKEMLDLKSEFLQHYVTSLLETNGPVEKQLTGVLE